MMGYIAICIIIAFAAIFIFYKSLILMNQMILMFLHECIYLIAKYLTALYEYFCLFYNFAVITCGFNQFICFY